jgi:hypothetical protein
MSLDATLTKNEDKLASKQCRRQKSLLHQFAVLMETLCRVEVSCWKFLCDPVASKLTGQVFVWLLQLSVVHRDFEIQKVIDTLCIFETAK